MPQLRLRIEPDPMERNQGRFSERPSLFVHLVLNSAIAPLASVPVPSPWPESTEK